MNQPVKTAAVKPSPLGRGLSALFGDADASYQPAAKLSVTPVAAVSGEPVKANSLVRLPTTMLRSGAFQPRHHFDETALQELAASIRERGVLEPLLVRALPGKDQYEIIAGERRWRAAQIAGVHHVPALVQTLTDREALEFGIIENVQREDLSPLEEGEGYQRLIEEFGHTQDALSKILGKSRPHITNMLRILTLPKEVRQYLAEGKLTTGHAKTLVPLKNAVEMAHEIVRRGLNVRQTEALAKKAQSNSGLRKPKAESQVDADVQGLERELEKVIGLKVRIVTKGKGGALTLNYTDLDQLDEIIRKLRA